VNRSDRDAVEASGFRAGSKTEVDMERSFDRAAEDIGNIVALEHVNVTVPDPQLATTFYVSGLG